MVNRGTNQQSSAPYNRRIVLDVIRRHGSLSRKDIVDRVALSPQTVANITSDLESVGLVVARRLKVQKSRGQPPIVFELNPNGGTSIGINIEPGRVRAALVNLVGQVIRKQDVEVDTHDRRGTLTVMVAVVKDLAGVAAATGPVRGVGVALPGPFAVSSMSFVGPTVLEGWTDLSALDELHRITGFPVIYSVDSVAGALGESLFGTAKNLNNFFYMHFGVGLGGTLVANRSAYKGANSNATEIGHVPIVPDGKECYCGNRGCLERYLSLHSLAEALGRTDVKDGARELLVEMLAASRADVAGVVSRSRRPPAQCGVHDREPARSRDDRDRRLGAQGAGRAHRCARGAAARIGARRRRVDSGPHPAVGA